MSQEIGPGRLALTITEAARALGISRATAYELVKRGEIPSVSVGARLRVPRAALEELLATPREAAGR